MDLLLGTPSDSGLVGLAMSEDPASGFIISTGWMRIAATSLFNTIPRDISFRLDERSLFRR
jgi:hypothetical protein